MNDSNRPSVRFPEGNHGNGNPFFFKNVSIDFDKDILKPYI